MVNPTVYMTTNAMGNLFLLEEMRERGIKKYVLASTSSLYAGQKMPFVETLAVNTPTSAYAVSKKSAEAAAVLYRLWAGGSARHGRLSIYQMDRCRNAHSTFW